MPLGLKPRSISGASGSFAPPIRVASPQVPNLRPVTTAFCKKASFPAMPDTAGCTLKPTAALCSDWIGEESWWLGTYTERITDCQWPLQAFLRGVWAKNLKSRAIKYFPNPPKHPLPGCLQVTGVVPSAQPSQPVHNLAVPQLTPMRLFGALLGVMRVPHDSESQRAAWGEFGQISARHLWCLAGRSRDPWCRKSAAQGMDCG